MRKSLGTLALILIILAVIGANRDWFSVQRAGEGKKREVHLSIDREKIRSDTRQAAEVARELGSNIEQKVQESP